MTVRRRTPKVVAFAKFSFALVDHFDCQTVTMAYVLGSQVESMTFTDAGVEYHPAGTVHAVDTDSPTFRPDAVVGYAVCGTAVRVWPERPFEPDAVDSHDQCVAITRRDRA